MAKLCLFLLFRAHHGPATHVVLLHFRGEGGGGERRMGMWGGGGVVWGGGGGGGVVGCSI